MTETQEQIKERQRQEDLQRLRGFRPIDDSFMRALFSKSKYDNKPLAQLVFRIIIGKPDLIITNCDPQFDMKRVTGARSICLDAYGTDSQGIKYDLEVQKDDGGASPHRVRYHSSVLDIENLDAGQKFEELPDTYVIFITEKDHFGDGAATHLFQRMDVATHAPLGDGASILYVNGAYRGDDEIGRLMHDFNCTDAKDMNYPLLAERTRYLKENPKGVESMCKIMEDMRNEAIEEKSKIIAKTMFEDKVSVEKIALYLGYTVEIIREWLGLKTA